MEQVETIPTVFSLYDYSNSDPEKAKRVYWIQISIESTDGPQLSILKEKPIEGQPFPPSIADIAIDLWMGRLKVVAWHQENYGGDPDITVLCEDIHTWQPPASEE